MRDPLGMARARLLKTFRETLRYWMEHVRFVLREFVKEECEGKTCTLEEEEETKKVEKLSYL
jgi:hypothetical protein